MKKEIVRREALKEKLKGKSYPEVIQFLKERFDYSVTKATLINWMKRFNESEWDFRDISQRPKTIHYKFTKENKKEVVNCRKEEGFSSQKLRIKLREKNIFMSESTIKRIVKGNGLSNGNKMEGIKLKWVRFERDNPNSMWQIDGTELADGTWLVLVEDDCSRYCIGAMIFDTLTTDNLVLLLELCIKMHGKPREILTDNGHEFGGTWKDSQFDKWCNLQEIVHIRASIHKPTTLGKIGALQQTYFREISYCNNDLEAWRMRYNCERPHESLRMLTPLVVYFQYRRHKKHYDL
jgi:transposase InsO family protein